MGTRIIKWFPWLLLAPAFLPLVYINGFIYPYVTLKTLLIRALGIMAVALWGALIVAKHPFHWERIKKPVTWIPGVLLTVAYATSFFGLNLYRSFWSTFERGDGLFTLTIVCAFFYLVLLYAHARFFENLFKMIAWTASVVAVHALLQAVQTASGVNIPFVFSATGRVGGTLGNAAFLASYLGISFFITLGTIKTYAGKWNKILFVGAGLQLVAIILSATRGTLLALMAIGVIAGIYLAIKGMGRARTYARVGIAVFIIIAALFFVFREPLTHFSIEPIRRIASLSLTDTTVASRLFAWKTIFSEALHHPWKGYGAEHVGALFNTVYDPTAIVEQWFDRSHNAYLDYFVQYGVLGFGLYIALIAFAMHMAWRAWKRGYVYGVYILCAVGVYAIQNFFVFDTASTLWLLLLLYASTLVYEDVSQKDISGKEPYTKLGIRECVTFSSVGIVALIALFISVVQPMRANMALAEGYTYHASEVMRAVRAMKHGLSLRTYADLEYGYQAYVMYTERQQKMLQGAERLMAYIYARDILEKNFASYPYDARTATYFAHVLDSAPPEVAVDEAVLHEVLTRAIELSPKRAQPWYILANVSLKKGDAATQLSTKDTYYRTAIETLQEYVDRVPTLDEPRFIIAGLYLTIGNKQEAARWADEGLALYKGSSTSASRAVRYYIATEDWEHATRFLEIIVANNPTDYDSWYDLAKTNYLIGNKARTQEIVDLLRREKPGLVESDQVFFKAFEASLSS